MQQTLPALMALLIAMFISFHQKQATVQNQSQAVQAETEPIALSEERGSIQGSVLDRAAFEGTGTCDDTDDFCGDPAIVPHPGLNPDGGDPNQHGANLPECRKDPGPATGYLDGRRPSRDWQKHEGGRGCL